MKTGYVKSSIVLKRALRNLLTREAMLKCDFSGDLLDGVESLRIILEMLKFYGR
jgi:hypothetical protein